MQKITLNTKLLKKKFNNIKNIIYKDSDRENIKGFLLETTINNYNKPVLRLVATTGMVLALTEIEIDNTALTFLQKGVFASKDFFDLVQTMLKNSYSPDVSLCLTDEELFISNNTSCVSEKLNKVVAFPNYKSVVPLTLDCDKFFIVGRNAFRDALKAEATRNIDFLFLKFRNDEIIIRDRKEDTDSKTFYYEEVFILQKDKKSHNSPEFDIALSKKLLLTVLDSLESKYVMFEFQDGDKPETLPIRITPLEFDNFTGTPTDDKTTEEIRVFMPLRV